MNQARFLMAIAAIAACASTATAGGYGCGLPGCHNAYDCNYANNLWAGYQPTQPVYVPRAAPDCGGCCLLPHLAAKLHGHCGAGGCCDTGCCDTGCCDAGPAACAPACGPAPCCNTNGWWYGFGTNDCCGLGALKCGALAGKLRSHFGGCHTGCGDAFPYTGYSIPAANCTFDGSGGYHGAAPGPAIENHVPGNDAPPAGDFTNPAGTGGPFDAAPNVHETAPPQGNGLAPSDPPAELLPAGDEDEGGLLDGDA